MTFSSYLHYLDALLKRERNEYEISLFYFSGTDFAGPPSYTVTSPRPSVDNTASGMYTIRNELRNGQKYSKSHVRPIHGQPIFKNFIELF